MIVPMVKYQPRHHVTNIKIREQITRNDAFAPKKGVIGVFNAMRTVRRSSTSEQSDKPNQPDTIVTSATDHQRISAYQSGGLIINLSVAVAVESN